MSNFGFSSTDLLKRGNFTPSFSGADIALREINSRRQTALPTVALQQLRWNSDQGNLRQVIVADPSSDVERAFDQLVALKIQSADFAMHLDTAWRAGLFSQLDQLLDADEWDFDDAMPSVESFRTFLRLIIHNKVANRPGLGATRDGKIIAAWTAGKDRLTVECMPDDTIRWVLVKYEDGQRVSSANTGPVSLLRKYLAPYEPGVWFG
jgi:hypothetical protein